LQDYRRAAALELEADANFVLGFSFERLGEPEEAIKHLEAGLAMDPNRVGAQVALEKLRAGGE
jgi:hypothetical protein